ncbi:hypothetical protein [Dictyobacter formicarum]|uniref:Uncharacterized protein n=1 Tax=Dictyobacter formicarum TaxID=2778368 RepID=A0ABQ3VNF5_9CHLR|nr:hypothetical protein [Dictyobacter formicarum]GHO87128.1 hypothetical protein KSZ_51340 [Dictyobacter formicarum]
MPQKSQVGLHKPQAFCPPRGIWEKPGDAQTPHSPFALREDSLLWIELSFFQSL